MTEKVTLQHVNRYLMCGVLVTVILVYAQKVLIPITFSIFFAMLFTPLSNLLEKKGMKRIFSALLSVLIMVLITAGISMLVYMQAKKLGEKLPEIEEKSKKFIEHVQQYVSQKLDVPEQKQEDLINKQVKSGASSIGKSIKSLLEGIFGIVGAAVIVLIFTFLFLFQREKYESFFVMLYRPNPPAETKKLLHKISGVAQSYLTGRVLSIIIFTILFTTGFLIVGLENAFLLAFIAALLTIVPYVGSIIGGLFPFAVALVTADSNSVAVGALVVVVIIQCIDNYFIEPYIIGGEVSISGFFTILILLVGGLIWGVAGMVLFLPILGVAKIICDEVPALKPYGYLLGDQKDGKQSSRLWARIKKIFHK